MKNIVDVLSLQNRQQENKLQKVKPTDYRYVWIKFFLEISFKLNENINFLIKSIIYVFSLFFKEKLINLV